MLYLITALVLGALGITIGQVPEQEALLRSGVDLAYLSPSSIAIALIFAGALVTIAGLIDLAIKEKN